MGHGATSFSSRWLIPITVLSLAVGAAVALFGPLDALVLQPLPFPQPQELVQINRVRIFDANDGTIAHRRALAAVFRGVAAYWGATASWLGGGTEARSVVVTREFFPTLGVRLRRGGGFAANGAGDLPQAIIGYRLWRETRRAHAAGTVQIDGRYYHIAGVAPRGFSFPGGSEIWELGGRDRAVPDASAGDWVVFGRLRAGVSLAAAGARLRALTRGFRDAQPAGQGAATLVPLYEFMRGDRRNLLWSVWAAALGLLLLASGGTASLIMMRGIRRRREYAVRLVLGTTPARLARVEIRAALAPALGACGIGLLLAYAASRWLHATVLAGAGAVRAQPLPQTLAVAGGAILLVLAATAAGAAAPVWQIGTDTPSCWLRAGGQVSRLGRMGGQEWLTAAQICLALILVAGAVLLAWPALARARQPLGFKPAHLIAVQSQMPEVPEMAAFQHALRATGRFTPALAAQLQAADGAVIARDVPLAKAAGRALATLPGVAGVAIIYPMPFGAAPLIPQSTSAVPARAATYRNTVSALQQGVRGDALAMLGVPLLAGRTFNQRDLELTEAIGQMAMPVPGAGSAPLPPAPVIINAALARRLWPQGNAVGKRIWTPAPGLVIGVVADMRESADQTPDAPMVFQLLLPGTFSFLVKARPGARLPVLAAEGVRAVQQLNPAMAPPRVSRLADQVARGSRASRLLLCLFVAFAILGLAAAALGIYGSTQEAMMARTQEFALRAALGARPASLYGLAARRGARILVLALPAAALGSWLLAHGLAHALHGSSAAGPWVAFAIAAILLAALTAGAHFRLARHAVYASPGEALRH